MQEIEVKILEINVEETIKKIEQAGGLKTYEGKVITTYYDSPKNKLHQQGSVLRLRRKEGCVLEEHGGIRELRSTEITFKRKLLPVNCCSRDEYIKSITQAASQNNYKSMEELETLVGDYQTMDQILRGIGFTPFRELEKKRISYRIKDILDKNGAFEEVHFDIDFYAGIPPFLEIEAKSKELVKQWIKHLGYQLKDAKPWTASEVFKHYGKKC